MLRMKGGRRPLLQGRGHWHAGENRFGGLQASPPMDSGGALGARQSEVVRSTPLESGVGCPEGGSRGSPGFGINDPSTQCFMTRQSKAQMSEALSSGDQVSEIE